MDLAGNWALTDGQQSVLMPIPGDAIVALHRAGVIPDPYFGRNEMDCRWVAERDWVLSRSFDHDGSGAELVIEGLDCVAEVRLNGALVLTADNAHRVWRADVSQALQAGRNEVAVTFRSSVREAARRQAGQPFFVPFSANNTPIPHGNMLRKQQCDFGWDWNIALATFGIYGRIGLEAGARIGDVIVTQTHVAGVATVAVSVHATCEDVTASLCGVTVSAPVVAGLARLTLNIENPVLWWPAGSGGQALHTLTIASGAAVTTRTIGLRDLALVSVADAAGRSFGFTCNGKPVFARGANWIPADALAGRIDRDAVRDLLQSAVDAHMNMIRIWGGGRYEPDWFYDLCDEMGLMVWQDFMFACHLYPSTADFLANVDAEVRDVVARIHHHACLALWCGDNELIGALTWFEESRKDRDRYLVNYDRLNRTIETALKQTVDTNWWPSSPSPGPLSFGDAWHDDSSGDMHFWSVWHEGRSFEHYRDVKPRFCSEFGFQSYPSMDVIRRFAEPADWNIASPVMEAHQKNAGGNARIAETMFRNFRFPVDFPNFVYLSQVQQGMAIKTAVTAWRALKPHCMGTLIWQLNDTWPVCSWSSLDHGGGWKLLHHMARHFYAPVTVIAVPDGAAITLRGVNDAHHVAGLTLTVSAVSMAGVMRPLTTTTADIGTAAAQDLVTVARADLKPGEVLHWAWSGDAAGADLMELAPWKAHDLLDPQVAMTVTQMGRDWTLTLTAQALAPYVAVESDLPGRFSDNAFALIPGQPRTITFTPQGDGTPIFIQRDLHAATYGA
jgi:beta-mannosidase